MKPIDQMTLAELQENLRWMGDNNHTIPFEYIQKACYDYANRIHDLTRWIPVSERMPTEEDADQFGHVRMWWRDKPYGETEQHYTNLNPDFFSHWQRTTPPEDK